MLCWLQPFYGQEIRLVVCGYVRPEANFTSLEALVQRIHKDAEVSKAALSHPQLQGYAAEAFLQPAGAAAAAAVAGDGAGEGVAELEEVAVAASG
jgi:riboflavin kinase